MIRAALLLCAGIIAAACFACVPPVSPAPPVNPASVCNVVANVQVVSPSFNPTNAVGTPSTTGPASANIQAAILAAYADAPPFFRNQLCSLNGLYVTSDAQSWGYRDINNGSLYVALSTGLWGPSGSMTLDQYENRVFGPPLSWPLTDPNPPKYLTATPNDATTTILAALAHEFGHIFWSQTLVSPRGSNPQSSRFCDRILDGAWNGGPAPGAWKAFEDVDANPADILDDPSDPAPPGDPGPGEAKLLRMIKALQNGNVTRAHKILRRIMALGRPFPSLLGAYSADEQFVESFQLYTLLHAVAPLTSAPLQVSPGVVVDVPATLSSRPKLTKVLSCFDSLVNPSQR